MEIKKTGRIGDARVIIIFNLRTNDYPPAMKKILACLLLLSLLACQKKPKPAEVEQRLKKAMSEFLYQSVNNDSSRVKFDVKEVIYFEEAGGYECEFKVNMVQAGKDTLGVMKAVVTKDFTKVSRKL